MKKFVLIAASLALLGSTAGCSRFALDARDLGEPVSFTRATGQDVAQGTAFTTNTRVGYCGWLFNLVTLKDANLSAMLDKEIKAAGGTAIRNVTVKKQMSFVDGLISIVSLGFYVPETITVQGEVVSDKTAK